MSGGLGRKDSHRPRVKGYAWDLWHDRDTPDAKKNSVTSSVVEVGTPWVLLSGITR